MNKFYFKVAIIRDVCLKSLVNSMFASFFNKNNTML